MGSSDFLNKIIGTVLAFMILVVGPIATLVFSQQLAMERGILNEMNALVDKVTDTGKLSDNDLADFKLGVASFGVIVKIETFRYITVVVPEGTGTKRVSQLTDDLTNFNKGDTFQVRVEAIDMTGAQKLMYRISNLVTPKFDKTLAGRVRN